MNTILPASAEVMSGNERLSSYQNHFTEPAEYSIDLGDTQEMQFSDPYAAYYNVVQKCIEQYGNTAIVDGFNYGQQHFTGLSFLKTVLRQQDLDYLLFSTWCMAAEDIRQIDEWISEGRIRRMDAYVGEIFPTTYKVEWAMLKDMMQRHGCGRLVAFRNHSKIFAGYGRFPFVIESSANINTNPRTENACITIDKGLFEFMKEYFDGINSIV